MSTFADMDLDQRKESVLRDIEIDRQENSMYSKIRIERLKGQEVETRLRRNKYIYFIGSARKIQNIPITTADAEFNPPKITMAIGKL